MDCRGFLRNLAMTEAWQSRTGTGRSHCEPRQRRSNPDKNGPRSLRASTEAKQSRSGTGRGHCEPRQRRSNPLLSQRVGARVPLNVLPETQKDFCAKKERAERVLLSQRVGAGAPLRAKKEAPVSPAEMKNGTEVRHLPLGERVCDDEIL